MDAQLPEGNNASAPLGRSAQTYLAIGYHTEFSTLSGRGDRCSPYPRRYSAAFACSVILYPLKLRATSRPSLSALPARRPIGLTLFRAASTNQEGSAFPPAIVTSAHSHQARECPIACHFGQSPKLQVTVGSSKLDDV